MVVGQNGMDFVGNGNNQIAQKLAGNGARGTLVQLHKSELRRSIYGNEEIKLALSGLYFGDVPSRRLRRQTPAGQWIWK